MGCLKIFKYNNKGFSHGIYLVGCDFIYDNQWKVW